MFCKQCGKEIEDGSSFCPFCGAGQADDAQAQQQAQNQQAQQQAQSQQAQQQAQSQQPQQPYQAPYNNNPYNQTYYAPPKPQESGAGWGVLGFFFPVVGLILFLVWKDDHPARSKGAGIGALVSVILNVVWIVIYVVIVVIAAGSAGYYAAAPALLFL